LIKIPLKFILINREYILAVNRGEINGRETKTINPIRGFEYGLLFENEISD